MKQCEDCNLCYKLPEINYFKDKKESYTWCKDCNIGVGCKIYNKRPQGCREFYCLYSGGVIDLKPNKVGFFIFVERAESVQHKILTIYTEPNRLDKIPSLIMKDAGAYGLVDQGYAFHIRYSKNDDELAIFDLQKFGMSLKKVSRKELENDNS
mgnify:CR=1 FL=1